jgi:hypothetical protein
MEIGEEFFKVFWYFKKIIILNLLTKTINDKTPKISCTINEKPPNKSHFFSSISGEEGEGLEESKN